MSTDPLREMIDTPMKVERWMVDLSKSKKGTDPRFNTDTAYLEEMLMKVVYNSTSESEWPPELVKELSEMARDGKPPFEKDDIPF